MSVLIRHILPSDNKAIASIIRDTLAEFGANHPGTVFYDPTTDTMYELFQRKGAVYNIAELNGAIVGGAGIYPTEGLPEDTCELVKMYLLPKARGSGLGKKLIALCLEQAKGLDYKNVYLESMPELRQALQVYAKFGFEYLKGPLGNSGHTGCSLWMLKELYPKQNLNRCHVCGFDYGEPTWGEDDKTSLHEICPCCGNHFGYNDCNSEAIRKYRSQWIIGGAKWSNPVARPADWDFFAQVKNIPEKWI